MRRLCLAAAAAGLAFAGPAHAARVEVMVAGKERVLRGPTSVKLAPRTVRVHGRRCAVGARTPLSALLGTRLRVRLRDYGSCGRSARDAGGLFVTQVGPDRNRGRNGWVYKVGRRVGSGGAADPAGPFGRGPLRGGRRVLWFWCVLGPSGACQRTLEVTPAATTVAPGAPLRVTVRGYDDQGRGVPVAGAVVRLGGASAVSGADGSATLAAPSSPGRVLLRAERAGMVPSFARAVRIG